MAEATLSTQSVDDKIEAFLTKKAMQYPGLKLAQGQQPTDVTPVRPLHEVVTDRLLHSDGAAVRHILAMLKLSTLSTYSRTN